MLPEGRYDALEVHTTIHLQTDDGKQIEKYNPDDPFHDPALNPILYSGYVKVAKEGTLSAEWVWLFDAAYPAVARAAMDGVVELFRMKFIDNIEEVK